MNPTLIRQSVVDLGDRTYGVQFFKGATKTFYRVDADLPAFSASSLAYAGFGAQGSTWAAILEKAWAFFRTGAGTYASIENGAMRSVVAAFGKTSKMGMLRGDANKLAATLLTSLREGKSITVASLSRQTSNSPVVGSHAYSVETIVSDGKDGYNVIIKNPWGVDGYKSVDGANDGYVTLTAAQFASSFQNYTIANA